MNDIVECVAGEDFRYWVSSNANPEARHLVDLVENFPLGECGCPDFVCRRLPAYRKTKIIKRCRHLEAAREQIMNHLIRQSSRYIAEK